MLDCYPEQKCGVGSQVLLRKHLEQDCVSFVWETSPHACLSVLDGHKKGWYARGLLVALWCYLRNSLAFCNTSIRFEPSPDDPAHSTVCSTNVHFDPRPVGESGVGAAMKSVVSTYEGTIGFLRQAVFTFLHEQATSSA